MFVEETFPMESLVVGALVRDAHVCCILSLVLPVTLNCTSWVTLSGEVMCVSVHLNDLVYTDCQAAKVCPSRHCGEGS